MTRDPKRMTANIESIMQHKFQNLIVDSKEDGVRENRYQLSMLMKPRDKQCRSVPKKRPHTNFFKQHYFGNPNRIPGVSRLDHQPVVETPK